MKHKKKQVKGGSRRGKKRTEGYKRGNLKEVKRVGLLVLLLM